MRTPAGKECQFFYGDYFRGRHVEECRLMKDNDLAWLPHFCNNCPIPNIQLANACENMRFKPNLYRPYIIVGKHEVHISTHCVKCECSVKEPQIGCGQCHTLPDVFILGPNDTDAPA